MPEVASCKKIVVIPALSAGMWFKDECLEYPPGYLVQHLCEDAYASAGRYRDMVAHLDSSDSICRGVDEEVRLSQLIQASWRAEYI